ncbi:MULTISPECIES: D-Ala-D-Ala carboxypeptidase family metallohydrolase [Acinetobacter]|uniref:D-Ala-D-Ala carboxypeptidase family metallohydrolase n=1 Tax=Acinetobacter TaxID=469 RepID=UPI000EA27ABD|nr:MULTISPECIES: D-Ala-D-Ala carboxypeptidase family metallohydrolase [Acinetobacter]RKG45182.1 peptidase M15 [Acinetobacter cumulans]RZG60080.1 peptidase M15 [Acinetobacter sp. WCHAc060006]
MKNLIKGLLGIVLVPIVFVGCTSSPKKGQIITDPSGKRIFIPQERVSFQRPIPPKTVPYAYNNWIAVADHLRRVREYEVFLEKNGVGNIIPSFELMRTARDWQKCGREQYMVPSRELWANQIPTLRVFKYLIAANVLTDFSVTSVYRDLPLNQCAGGTSSSRHLYNSAIDFRIGPEYPQPEDYAYIENSKFKLCQFWSQHGQSLNMGLGLYASGQIHIDTQGYRTWGPDLSSRSSMCNY